MVSEPLASRFDGLGIMVGLAEEERLIRHFLPFVPVALSHAEESGVQRALQDLLQAGATKFLSFGCAGGLAPTIKPGTVILAHSVAVPLSGDNATKKLEFFSTTPRLNHLFKAEGAVQANMYHSARMVASAREKAALYQETGCLAVDMESGTVARFCAESGMEFSVLRVVCDDARRDLPHAAAHALREGCVHIPSLLRSLLQHPGQIGALIGLGREAARARQSMKNYLKQINFDPSF